MPGTENKNKSKLVRRCNALRRQLKQLNSTQTVAQAQIVLLEALCRSFALIQSRIKSEDELNNHEDAGLELVQPGLLEQQLSSTTPLQQPQEDPDVQRIAPRSDPLALLDRVVTSATDTTSLTALELASWLKAAIREGSVQLQLKRLGTGAAAAFDKQLESLWMKYLLPAGSSFLAAGGKQHMLTPEVTRWDLSRLEPDPQAFALATSKHADIPPLLGLSLLQCQDIAAGHALFRGLFDGIVQQTNSHMAANRASTGDSGQRSSRGGSSSSSSAELLRSLRADLDAGERDGSRMWVLMRKEYALRAVECFWVIGCLSWEQLTLANILCWPHVLRLPLLAQEIAAYHEQQQ